MSLWFWMLALNIPQYQLPPAPSTDYGSLAVMNEPTVTRCEVLVLQDAMHCVSANNTHSLTMLRDEGWQKVAAESPEERFAARKRIDRWANCVAREYHSREPGWRERLMACK